MANQGQWTHIVDHAWELHGLGCQYTVHEDNDGWVARGFTLSPDGSATKRVEESAPSMERAQQIAQRWDDDGACRD